MFASSAYHFDYLERMTEKKYLLISLHQLLSDRCLTLEKMALKQLIISYIQILGFMLKFY